LAEQRSWGLEERQARQVCTNLQLQWLVDQPLLPELFKGPGHAFDKIGQAGIGGVTPSSASRTGKMVPAVRCGVLSFSAEWINGGNPAAGNLRLPGQSRLFFNINFLLSVI
jgi:hypothetical protein